MKKLLVFLILLPGIGFCEGPLFLHKDTYVNQEFDNTYQDLRKKTSLQQVLNSSNTWTAQQNLYVASFTATKEVPFTINGVIVATFSTNGMRLLGTNTNDNAATGYYGEYISSKTAALTLLPTTGNYGDLLSIVLTAGDWDVSACVLFNGGTSFTGSVGISQTSGNSTTGLVEGDNWVENSQASIAGTSQATFCIPSYRVSLSGGSTIYLKFEGAYAGTPKSQGRISARRAR